MRRRTSDEAYRYIIATGILGNRRTQAYRVLYEKGPLTGQELCQVARCPGLWKRLSELEEMRVIEAVGERPCGVTGRNVTLWDVTDVKPTGPYRKRPKPEPGQPSLFR